MYITGTAGVNYRKKAVCVLIDFCCLQLNFDWYWDMRLRELLKIVDRLIQCLKNWNIIIVTID